MTPEQQALILKESAPFGENHVTVRKLTVGIGRYQRLVWRVEGCSLVTRDYTSKSAAINFAKDTNRQITIVS